MSEAYVPKRPVGLARISDDKEGLAAGVGRQSADIELMAERLGWPKPEIVVENSTSAFKRRKILLPNGRHELRTVRPGFRQVLEQLTSGASDGFIAYDLDRTARDPRDLEDLIDVIEQTVPRIPVRSVTGSLDLSNDAGVTMARVMVAIANKSSRDTQRRIKRKNDDMAREGRYAGGGARRFGYERDGMTVREAEAEVVREAVARILAGESATSICRDFDARLILPVKAQTWSSNTLLGILKSARIAGLREHRGEVIGPAAWPAIIDADTRERLLVQLETNSRGLGKPALKYWAGRLLWCGLCGQPLKGAFVGSSGSGKWRYWCATNGNEPGCGRIGINGPGAEQEITEQVMEYLRRPDVAKALTAGTQRVAVDETRRLLEDDERQLRELAQAYGAKQISLSEWLEARAPIEARVQTYQQALRKVVPQVVREVLEAPDPAAAWQATTPEVRREIAARILETSGHKGWLVKPADPAKPRRFDPERMAELAPADEPAQA